MNLEKILSCFHDAFLPMKSVDYGETGLHAEVLLEKEELHQAAKILYDEKFYLVFVTAVSLKPASCIVYQFAHHETLLRIGLRLFAHDHEAPTLSTVFDGADWYEREIHDFFGVVFTGHPDMRPLILSEMDTGFYPLLKGEEACLDAETLGFLPPRPTEESGNEEGRIEGEFENP